MKSASSSEMVPSYFYILMAQQYCYNYYQQWVIKFKTPVDNLEEKLFFVNNECKIIEHTNGKFRVNVKCECIGEACRLCADAKEIKLLYCYQKWVKFQEIYIKTKGEIMA